MLPLQNPFLSRDPVSAVPAFTAAVHVSFLPAHVNDGAAFHWLLALLAVHSASNKDGCVIAFGDIQSDSTRGLAPSASAGLSTRNQPLGKSAS